MGIKYHLTLCTPAALAQSQDKLIEPGLFKLGAEGNVVQELDKVFSPGSEAAPLVEEGGANGVSDGSAAVNENMDLGARFMLGVGEEEEQAQARVCHGEDCVVHVPGSMGTHQAALGDWHQGV